ncbi:MAG: 6-phosphogluconolactonase, partial [Erysipelotrichaceae bacterium]|nr:6-phosphogluconolactonase [Erysipelotrichaceae bacterium]
HIGFNEPNTPFDSLTHVVDLTLSTRQDNARFFENDLEKVPHQAITMGIGTILRSKRIILIATGTAKNAAIQRLKAGVMDLSVPATALISHPDVIVYVDEAAYK